MGFLSFPYCVRTSAARHGPPCAGFAFSLIANSSDVNGGPVCCTLLAQQILLPCPTPRSASSTPTALPSCCECPRRTLDRIARSDQHFPKLFKIGSRMYVRLADLQSWIDLRAKAA
jgi:hypothetical protein